MAKLMRNREAFPSRIGNIMFYANKPPRPFSDEPGVCIQQRRIRS
jgi:hypothetical protein